MSFSNPFTNFGVCSIAPYRRSDKTPYGLFQIVAGGEFNFTGESEDLFGGCNLYPYASEVTTIPSEFNYTVKQLDAPQFWEINFAADLTQTTGSSYTIGTLTDYKGTSVGTDISSISVNDSTALKDGTYVIKAASSDTVNVYGFTQIDGLKFANDDLKINSSALTISTGGTVIIGATGSTSATGLTITKSTDASGMTAGDTATFTVNGKHDGIDEITIGSKGNTFQDYGLLLYSAKQQDGTHMEIDVVKFKPAGGTLPVTEQTWTEVEISGKALYDSTLDCVAKVRQVRGDD
jgi:hypothetical protein